MAETVKIQIDGVGQRLGVPGQALQPDGHQEQHADTGPENHPAFKEMQKPLGLADAIAVDQHPDHADAERIHEDGQRGGGQKQRRLVPLRATIQNGEQIGKRQDREQVAQAGTGFGDLQLVDAKVDHVPFKKHRHPGQFDEPDTQLRRYQLQHDRQFPIDELRQWQHENQMQHRGPVGAPFGPAKAHQHQPAGPEDQGIGDHIGDADQIAQNAQDQRCHQQRHARHPVDRLGGFNRWFAPQFPQEQIQRDHRDQRAIAVFRSDPGCRQRAKAQPEHRQRCQSDDRQQHEAGPVAPGAARQAGHG